MLDSTLRKQTRAILVCLKNGGDRATVKRCLGALALLEILEEKDDRVTQRGKTRH